MKYYTLKRQYWARRVYIIEETEQVVHFKLTDGDNNYKMSSQAFHSIYVEDHSEFNNKLDELLK